MTREDGLRHVSRLDLERLQRAATQGQLSFPVSSAGLIALHMGHLLERAPFLIGLNEDALRAVLVVALAERSQGSGPKYDLVWTGPEAALSTARDTAVVVRQLFEQAKKSVLLTAYSVDPRHGRELFAPLHKVVREHGVKVDIFLDLKQAEEGKTEEQAIDEAMLSLLQTSWEEDLTLPTLYYDPRTVSRRQFASLHAKCIVIDEKVSFVTSANLTRRGQRRNIEVGVLIEDEAFARELSSQWYRSYSEGLLLRWEKKETPSPPPRT